MLRQCTSQMNLHPNPLSMSRGNLWDKSIVPTMPNIQTKNKGTVTPKKFKCLINPRFDYSVYKKKLNPSNSMRIVLT